MACGHVMWPRITAIEIIEIEVEGGVDDSTPHTLGAKMRMKIGLDMLYTIGA